MLFYTSLDFSSFGLTSSLTVSIRATAIDKSPVDILQGEPYAKTRFQTLPTTESQ